MTATNMCSNFGIFREYWGKNMELAGFVIKFI